MNSAYAIVVHTNLRSCYFTIWGWCPVESILGSVMLTVMFFPIGIGVYFLRSAMHRRSARMLTEAQRRADAVREREAADAERDRLAATERERKRLWLHEQIDAFSKERQQAYRDSTQGH